MKSHKSSSDDKPQNNEESLHDHIITAMSDGRRLYFLFDEILDPDLQPDAADFSISVGEVKRTVLAASLKSAVRKNKSWSLISLLLEHPVEPGSEITITYQPKQWFLWSLDADDQIDPFEFTITVGDSRAVRGVSLDTDALNLEPVPVVLEEVDAEATISLAYDRRIKITFGRELDLAHQPEADDFRAESDQSWLNIGSVHLSRSTSKNSERHFSELWIMLRDPLAPGSKLEVGYKPPESSLCTKEGARVLPFRVAAIASTEEPSGNQRDTAKAAQTFAAALPQEEKSANIVTLFSEEDSSKDDADNPYAQREADEKAEKEQAEKEKDKRSKKKDELPDLEEICEIKEYEPKIVPENVPKQPEQVVRTYLTDRSSVTLHKEEIAAEMEAAEPELLEPEKISYLEHLKEASPIVKAGVGAGFLLVAWLFAAVLTFVIKLFGVNFSSSDDIEPVIAAQAPAVETRKPCEMSYHDGSRYEGECLGSKRDGTGAYHWASGDVYKGDWKDDKQHGNGMLQYKNGDVYTGNFENNLKHGMGAMHWSSGARYQGGYKNGKFDGRGTFWSVSGTRFEGVFKDGHTTTVGTCFLEDGSSRPGPCPR